MTVLIAVLSLIGAWQTGSGAWIYLKGRLAQVLLQQAWARSQHGVMKTKPWPWADTWPVARLIVPSQNVDLIVLAGAYGRTLAFGPGQLESGALPGAVGTTILTGHRDTHFRFLQRLTPADDILLETPDGQLHRYRMREASILDSREASILLDHREAQLVLVTCYPFNAITPGGPLRYLVTARADAH